MASSSAGIPGRRRGLMVAYLLITTASVVTAVLTSREADWEPVSLVLVLGAFNVASEVMAFKISRSSMHTWYVTSSAPLTLCIVMLGPAPGLAIGAIGLAAAAVKNRTTFPDLIANYASYGAFLVSGGLLCRWIAESLELSSAGAGFALLVLGAYLYTFVVSFLFISADNSIRYGDSFVKQWEHDRSRLLAESPTLLLAGATAYAYGNLGLEALGLLVVMQLMYQYFIRNLLLSEERALALQQRADELAALHGTLTEQAKHLSELSESRGRLVGQVLQAEEKERRRLAEALHDEALQNLLTARRGLAEPTNGGIDHARVGIDRTIEQLRGAIFNLHPDVLEHAGLPAALRAVARQEAERGGFRAQVDVDPGACGPHDALLFVLGREQLSNAAKHSGATEVGLTVARNNGRVVMEIMDDGCGMDPEQRRTAVERGHIGLASGAERVEALGGRFEIDSRPGQGTRIRTTLPVQGGL